MTIVINAFAEPPNDYQGRGKNCIHLSLGDVMFQAYQKVKGKGILKHLTTKSHLLSAYNLRQPHETSSNAVMFAT